MLEQTFTLVILRFQKSINVIIKLLNLNMYISGITVEKKKASLKLNSNTKLEVKIKKQQKEQKQLNQQQRPYSSQNKFIGEKNHYSVGYNKKMHGEAKHLSQNKITMKKPSEKRISNKVQKSSIQQKEKDNFALSLKPKLNKRPTSDATSILSIRLSADEMIKINCYFRYLPMSVLSSIGVKEQFMKNLAEQKDFKPLNPFKKSSTKKQVQQFWLKLNKQAQLKGKYKYRQKYNYAYSAQLKALQYKRRQFKKKKQQSSSTESDDEKEKCRDMDTWKKAMGIDGKVFIIKGKYPDLRQALLDRGWIQNTDKKSNFYDLRWTTKISDINFANLKPNQIVNHFDNNACLTSKYGLIKSIRSVMYPESMDIDKFYPKAYDLSDLGDFQNFIQMFKLIYCQSLVKKAYYKIEEVNLSKLKIAIIVTQRRLAQMDNILKNCTSGHFAFCSFNEWNFLNDRPCNSEQIQKYINNQICGDKLESVIQNLLSRLQQYEPQCKLNGFRNIWIVKPAFLSRGRGIKCQANLNDILDTCIGKQTQYVVQKYIQNPLIINKRKFDIRIWVVVQDYNPPKIWFYNQFYLRFCLQDYDTDALKNRYAHLTNNSVQKYNAKIGSADLDSSMWDRQTFQKYIVQNYGEEKFKQLLGKMKEIVIATILGTTDQVYSRKGSFQQMGYDMMIDQNLNPWLIQVNSSPAMDYSTPITRKLVKMVMEDIAKIIVDLRKKKSKTKNVGQFKCIYSQAQSFKNKYYRIS